MISCRCKQKDKLSLELLPWTGKWPGDAECEEYGLYSKMTGSGWTPCSKDDPEAGLDLNTLSTYTWDKTKKKFVPPNPKPKGKK